jgi:transaldolase
MSSPSKRTKHNNALESIRAVTTVVADTGDVRAIEEYEPTDATTNPSLVLAVLKEAEFKSHLSDCAKYAKENKTEDCKLELAADYLFVAIGNAVLQKIKGRVSVECDARLSYHKDETLRRARRIIKLFEERGVGKERILIKIASTWEGIQAAKELEEEGIHCNLTLLFSMAQAIACAEANVTLISPFVGRIYDWHVKKGNFAADGNSAEDPGVVSVKKIYEYYKKFGYKTQVMGASFRNVGQIKSLAGCDLLTIAPKLLKQLQSDSATNHLKSALTKEEALKANIEKVTMNESKFRWEHNTDPCAVDLLANGIVRFANDAGKIDEMITEQLK